MSKTKAGRQADARTFGQDLMKGENLTYVKGARGKVDDTSRKNLAGGRATPGGSRLPASKLGPDGKFERGDLHAGVDADSGAGTSIFDPVLCELSYRWFCPPAGTILDPFAGGSVRGVVASKLGRQYIGVDLSGRQLIANREQSAAICDDPQPVWIEGDSVEIETLCDGVLADFVFSCPPYADLERYSDDPRDCSTMPYAQFMQAYRTIVAACVRMLKPDRFACFVVGDIRGGKAGFYRNFVSDTITAFQDCGAMLYNEAILVTALGSLPIRAGRQFAGGRKLGKTHQNVLVFCKGNPIKATEAIGEVECGDVLEEATDAK